MKIINKMECQKLMIMQIHNKVISIIHNQTKNILKTPILINIPRINIIMNLKINKIMDNL